MNSDEEYLDDLLNSLMDEDEGDGVLQIICLRRI